MSVSLNLRLPDELLKPLSQVADSVGQTPEEWIASVIQRELSQRDARLRRHFGAIGGRVPGGIDNDAIDVDLARAYAEAGEES